MPASRAPDPVEAPRTRGWVRLAAIILIGLAVAFAAWWLIRSDGLRESEHSRNVHELDIAARLIESWPGSARAMAVGNLLPTRVQSTHPADIERGWQGAARFLHPRLGAVYVHYGVPDGGTCPGTTAAPDFKGQVEFDKSRNRMTIVGTVPTSELWYADQFALADAGQIGKMTDAQAAQFVTDLGLSFTAPPRTLCFRADLPLAEIVDLPSTAPQIEKLLLIDRSGNLLAQLGGTPLPMAGVDELSRLKPLFDSFIDAAELTVSQGKSTAKPVREPGTPFELSAPTEVSIGGKKYFAYARTLNLPVDFPAVACKSTSADPTPKPGAVRTCLVMGLVPTADVNAASLRLSPAALTSFALILGLLVALLPLLKLRLIGPSDALRRIEVAAVAFGIVTAIAIGTLTLLFAQAHIRDNQRALARAGQIAAAMAGDFAVEFASATAQPIAFKKIPGNGSRPAIIEPAAPASLLCRHPKGDPVPLALTDDDSSPAAVYRDQSGEGWWPQLESSALFGEFGMAWPGFTQVLNRCDRGARANVSARPYFKVAINGSPGDGSFPPTRRLYIPGLDLTGQYRVGAVRAQPDGIEKVIIAAPFRRSRYDASLDRAQGEALGPQFGALLETFVARTFVAPVLPQPFSFIVVDADDPALPVLFDSNPSRIEVDRLVDDIGSDNARAAIANARCQRDNRQCGTTPRPFSTRFEGLRQHFVAQGLPGTPWVLLVHYPADAVARPIAETAVFAAGAWTGLALVTILALAALAVRRGPLLWHWSWPRPGGGRAYRRAARRVAGLAAVGTLACIGLAFVPSAASSWLRLAIAIATPIAAIAITVATLQRHADGKARFLDPYDESAFRTLAIALLLTIGALPMTVLWVDSRASSLAALDAEQVAHVDRAIATNIQTRKTLMRAFGTDSATAVTGAPAASAPDATGTYARLAIDLRQPTGGDVGVLTGNLRQWAAIEPDQASLDCTDITGRSMRTDARRILCDSAVPATTITAPTAGRWTVDFAWFRWFCFGLLGIGIGGLLLGALGVILRCLFGHGIPLEAVHYPGITRKPDGRLDLPAKVLVLNAPLALQLELLESWDVVDLSDPAPATTHQAGPKLLVTGLALALRDPGLRAAALTSLERMARTIDAAERAHDKSGAPGAPPDQIVVMTDLSPLDRILQAYESEQALAGQTLGEDGRREQLRWSRLFEAFATIGFTPTVKVSRADPDDPALEGFTENERRGIATLINEVSDLPEVVIDSLINSPEEAVAWYWRKHTRTGNFPFATSLYADFYDSRVRTWAMRIRPASRAAAVDYLRGTLIEHYQYVWIASSHAERVILDSLARGRTVNIASALALRSLVRRGLIRFTPVPRLMNESFAAFVLQAEKPMQINAWRAEQPRSLWQRSSLPLMIVIPLAIITLMAIALYSGERAIGLMPLLLGSAPALIGTLGALRRNQ